MGGGAVARLNGHEPAAVKRRVVHAGDLGAELQKIADREEDRPRRWAEPDVERFEIGRREDRQGVDLGAALLSLLLGDEAVESKLDAVDAHAVVAGLRQVAQIARLAALPGG